MCPLWPAYPILTCEPSGNSILPEPCICKKNASIYLEENIALAEELEESIRSELLSDPRKRKDVEEEALKDKEIPANDDIVILADVK